IITVAAVGFSLFNIFSGAKGYSVTSDSMKPYLNRGDVVFSKHVDFNSLRVGDVVTASVDNSKGYFTHRIVDIDKEKKTISTKGDNNLSVDPMDTGAEKIVGKMWYSVPLLGYFSIFLSGNSLITGLIILVIIAVVLIGLNIIFEKKKSRGDINE
ncbi:MAG: signal peptidase I, partial [Ruminococcus sp.]|nr:signal peptidase I [Candidatus Copronaster equi]